MRFNIWGGLVIPWILGIGLLKKNKELVRIVPFVWVSATFVSLWGDSKKYWKVKPKLKKRQYLTTMPFNLGLYPIASVFMVYLIQKTRKNTLWIIIFSLLTTVKEFGMLLFKRTTYGNGWNIIKTFFSYLIPYYLVYRYYLWTDSDK